MKRLLPLVAAAVGIAAWSAVAAGLPPALLPSPLEVLVQGASNIGMLAETTAHTALSALLGLAIAFALGSVGAVLFWRSRWLELALYPYALLIQTLPVIAIAPLLVVWLGYGTAVAACAAAIVAFFPILTSAHLGLRSATAEQVELLRLYNATLWQELTRLRIPAALPYLFGGLRTAGGLAVIGAIVGEFVGSNGLPPSLGYVVLRASRSAETGLSFAAIGCAALLALALFVVVRAVETRAIGRWFTRGAPR